MLEPIDSKDKSSSISQHQEPLKDNKNYIPIVFEVNSSKINFKEQYSQSNSNFVGETNSNASATTASNINLLTYSNTSVPLTATDGIYNSVKSTPILVPTNYYNNNNSNNTTPSSIQNYSLDSSSGVLKEGNFQNIAFVINNPQSSDLNSSNLIIASNVNGTIGFNSSTNANTNATYFDVNNNVINNGKSNFQQTQLQQQQQQQKFKITKSKKTSQLSSEIDEERTSQLVSEILKNIKEKTKELENLNQNLKTTGGTNSSSNSSNTSSHIQVSTLSNDFSANVSNLSAKNLTNSTKLNSFSSSYTNLNSNNPASDLSNSSFMSHDNEEKTMSQKTESNFYSSGELLDKFEFSSNSTTANDSFNFLSNAKIPKNSRKPNSNNNTQEAKQKKVKQENKSKSLSKHTLVNKRGPKHVVPLGWNRITQIDLSSNDKIICYTSPSGVALYSIQDIKTYLLSENTCKCGLECPINVNEVFSFDVKIKHTNAKLSNSYKHKCDTFKAETNVLKKLKKRLVSSAPIVSVQSSLPVVTATHANTKKSRPLANKSNENSDESFDETKISQLLLSGFLNSEDTSNSFDLNKSNSQLLNIFNLNHESNHEHKQNIFNFTNLNDRENVSQSENIFQNQNSNTLTDNFYNMKMNQQANYQNTISYENNTIFVNFSSSQKSKFFV
jgi:hypothetical protein